MSRRPSIRAIVCLLLAGVAFDAAADPVSVRHPQGWAHGFVEVTTTAGERIGLGDLTQRMNKQVVTSRLVLRFFDGSLDDETTVYSQAGQFKLLKDHHVQHGASFPKPSDVTIDVEHQQVITREESGALTRQPIDMPPDVYNGMASTILMNLPDAVSQATIAVVLPTKKPRIAHLKVSKGADQAFTLGGRVHRQANEYVVHVDLGGVAAVVAPIVGKEPPDYHVLILAGEDPAFIREDGPLFEGGPIWRVQQISAVIPERAADGAAPADPAPP